MRWGETLGALVKTDAAICLPPVEKLEKLSLAQVRLWTSGRIVNKSTGGTTKNALKYTTSKSTVGRQ